MKKESEKKLRVACVGAGYFSRFHYDAWHRIPEVELVAVCDSSLEAAQEVSRQYNLDAVYGNVTRLLENEQVDLVDIIIPPEGHATTINAVVEHGLHAVCQKPFGVNRQEAQQMTEKARVAGTELIIHENFRFMPWIRKIKSIVSSNILGQILNARFCLRTGDGQGADAYLDRQPYFQTMERLLIHETAIHFVDCFRFLFGEPTSLYAHLRRCNPVIKGEDSGLVHFEFSNGLSAVFDGNRLLDHASDNTRRTFGEMWIEGTEATLRLDGKGRLFLRKFGESDETEMHYSWTDKGFAGDCVYSLNSHIAAHFLSGGSVENRAEEYLNNLDIEEAIYHSHAEGRRIEL
ncbi:MAG: Gfo/Idh/MocA family protein [Methyloligellaceae bacterium]